jgi:hypothetical protein
VCHAEACCVLRYSECDIGLIYKEAWFWFSDFLNVYNFFRYLQEIGYTDTIIDVRSNRVRSLLGLNNNAESEENLNNAPVVAALNGNESSNKRASENQGRRTPAKKV